MFDSTLAPVLRGIRKLIGLHGIDQTADGALLHRFVTIREEAAFAALVHRHGPMVWGVCCRLLRQENAAEDVFQATFLVFARKAGSIRKSGSVAGWLHRVAHRLCLAAKAGPAPLEDISGDVPDSRPTDPSEMAVAQEVRQLLDEEVNRLPRKYRLPVVLCFFAGKTHAETAAELNWPVGTVAGRLARAKELLHRRLTRRGLTLSLGSLALMLAEEVARATPATVTAATVKSAQAFAVGCAAEGLASSQAIALANGLFLTTFQKRIWAGVAVPVLSSLGVLACFAVEKALFPPQHNTNTLPKAVPPAGFGLAPAPAQPKSPALQIPRNRMTHVASLSSVAFSRTGQTLAAGSGDGTIKRWDVKTGKEKSTLNGHTAAVRSVAYSPDGETLASSSEDGTIKLWDVKTGKELATFKGHTGEIYCVVYSPDGNTLASASQDRTIKRWDVKTGKALATFKGHTGEILSVAFSPDVRMLASASRDRTVRLWNLATGKEQATLKGHLGDVLSVAYSPDGKTLASGSHDLTIRLWDVPTAKERATLKGRHVGSSLVYHPEGNMLTAVNYDGGEIKLWDGTTGKELATFNRAKGAVLAYSRDGKTLAVAGGFEKHRYPVPVSAYGKPIGAAGGWRITLLDVATGEEMGALRGGDSLVRSVAYSPDGRTLALAFGAGMIQLLDVATGKARAALEGQTHRANSVVFSPDGKTLAAGNGDGTIQLWNATTGKELALLRGLRGPVNSVVFSPDGKTLASGSGALLDPARPWDRRDAGEVRLWDVATGTEKSTLKGHTVPVLSVAYSPDGKTLASSSHDNTIKLWDATTGKELATLKGHTAWVIVVVFGRDGKTLASGSHDNTIKLWDAATGKELATLKGHTEAVPSVAYSPDGKTLASGSYDNTIKLWNVATGEELATLKGHLSWVNSVAYCRDGKTLASGGNLNTIMLWDVSPEK
jgi:RNA polymerase sigma factor (sigma-70 family)